MLHKLKSRALTWVAGTSILLAGAMVTTANAQNKEPITIGFGMALTGPLAANGKMSLVAMQIWEDDINAKGGLLGRPVKLVYYDDQSNPSQVPGIYAKLLDVDKVDMIVSGYASTQIAAAMPMIHASVETMAIIKPCLNPLRIARSKKTTNRTSIAIILTIALLLRH